MAAPTDCPGCGAKLGGRKYDEFRTCDACGRYLPLSARERLDLLLDRGSFHEIDQHLVSVDPLRFADVVPYPVRLLRARHETGLDDAVVTGTGRIYDRPCVLAVAEFGFLGGSMGSVVGEKVARAMEHAARRRLPFVAVTSSGGARLQEGMLSLVQMAKTSAAAMRLHQAGIAFIAVLADPTTGGVFASFASQADLLLAEPGARISFAGARVVREVTGREPPPGFPSAEFLRDHGLVDAVVERPALRDRLGTLLDLLAGPRRPSRATIPREAFDRDIAWESPPDAWQAVELARDAARPTAVDYVERLFGRFVELRGNRVAGDDPAVVGGIGELGGASVVVVAEERGRGADGERRHHGHVGPAGFRKALRLLRLAGRLGLPLVTLIDTPGAELSVEAEAAGLAETISACLGELSVVPVPTVSVVIGEGGSGGALALGLTDRALMQANAIYSVIAPEGAAAILYHGQSPAREHVREVARALKLTAGDCLRLGVVDSIVPEPPGGAQRDPALAARLLGDALLAALADLSRQTPPRLVAARYKKYRRLGRYDTRLHRLVLDRLGQARERVSRVASRLIGTARGPDGLDAEHDGERDVARQMQDRRA